MGDINESILRPKAEESKPVIFDDVIRERAEDEDQVPLIAYPRTKDGVDDYEFFNGKQLHSLVDGAVKALMGMGLEPVVCRSFLKRTMDVCADDLNSTKIQLQQYTAPRHYPTSSLSSL